MRSNNEVFIIIESQQMIYLNDSTKNAEKSEKVKLYSDPKNFRSIPHESPYESEIYQELSPTCVSKITSAHQSIYHHLQQDIKKRQPEQFIQFSEITPNNIIRFLSDLNLNTNALLDWSQQDVSKFLRHPYLNLMSYDILDYIWNQYCYYDSSPTTPCFNGNNIDGLGLIYICLGRRKFHYYTENKFPHYNQGIKSGFIMCRCAKKLIYSSKYNNGKRISYLVERICYSFLKRKYMIPKLLSI